MIGDRVIGDHEPEDSWDDGDPLDHRLVLLARIVVDVDADLNPGRRSRRRAEVVHLLRKLADEVSNG